MERLRKSLGTKRAHTAKAAKAPATRKSSGGRKTARKSSRKRTAA